MVANCYDFIADKDIGNTEINLAAHLLMADISNRKAIKLLKALTADLCKTGLEQKLSFTASNDPWQDLEALQKQLIALADNPKGAGDSQLSRGNEEVVLECLRYFIQIYGELSQFSKMLF